MDWNIINGILRAIVPAALAYAVGKGWITQSQVGDITAAVLTLAAAGWSVKTNVQAPPPSRNVDFTATGRKMVIGFLIGAAALLEGWGGPAHAADLKPPPVVNSAAVPVCAIAFCTGPYAGGGLDGNGTSADILGSGLNGSVFGAGAIPSADLGYQYWNGSILFDGEVGIGYAMPTRNSVNGVNASPGQTGFLAYQEFQVGGQLSGLLGQGSQPSVTVPTALAPYLIAPYAAIGVAEQQGGSTGMDVGAGLKFAFSPNLLLDLGYRHYSLTTVSGPVVTKDDNLIRLRLNYVFKGF